MRISLLSISLSLLSCLVSSGQEHEIRDSLSAAVKTDSRKMTVTLGELKTDVRGIRAVVSPLGEGDPVRWVQGLPGITTGADGSTAFYVRGGNSGNNLFSLDGVPVYGYSHLLGLTTAIPQSVMGSVSLSKSDFDGSDSNFTAAHLKIESRLPKEDGATGVSANNFLFSVSDERRISGRTSYMVSARVSPLGIEYRLVRGMLPGILGGLGNFRAVVGDLYGKVHTDFGSGKTLDFSALGTMDSYSFSPDGESGNRLGWGNAFVQMRYRSSGRTRTDCSLYLNHYGNVQKQDRLFRGEWNHLRLNSDLTELSAAADWTHDSSDRLSVSWGIRLRGSLFRPGRVADVTNAGRTVLTNAFLQIGYDIPEILETKVYVRADAFTNKNDRKGSDERGFMFRPEGGVSVGVRTGRHFRLEASADRTVQFYHTLEGLPVGWSLDMIVPSGEGISPETAMQASIGGIMDLGYHSLSAGVFHKWMDNLVYYRYAQSLFSGGMADWLDQIDQGKGQSYGGEFLYEFQRKDWYARAAYTLSRTDRSGFSKICDGGVFNARFDRRSVFNATARWKGISAAFTLQSGHWENGAAQKYDMSVPGAGWMADYYSGINDFHMPTVLRLDLGYEFSFTRGRLTHNVNLGVCNVTNHFNPFIIYYEAKTETWKQLALLPVLPNFSWRIEF